MNFFQFLQQNWPELLALTREHLFLVFVSTGLAIVFGVPLGVLLTRVRRLQTPVLGIANVMQTIPSLALFGLLIPISFFGIGARTAIIALALYSFLPVIRNTVTGILGIDPKVREAATAMGLTDWQILKMVELPLAAPVILTGIRVAVVIAVGVATVAAAVGAGGRRGRSRNLYFSRSAAKRQQSFAGGRHLLGDARPDRGFCARAIRKIF